MCPADKRMDRAPTMKRKREAIAPSDDHSELALQIRGLEDRLAHLDGELLRISPSEKRRERALARERLRLRDRLSTARNRLCDLAEAANARRIQSLGTDVWLMIARSLDKEDWFPFAMSCRYFRELQSLMERLGEPKAKLRTNLCALPSASASEAYKDFIHESMAREGREEEIMAAAVLVRDSDLIKWLRARGCPWDEDTCASAAEGSDLDLLRWAVGAGCPMDLEACLDLACGEGHSEVEAWIISQLK